MDIRDAYHPVIKLLGQKPVANNVVIDGENTGILVTGPNMSGKSTYLNTIGVVQIITQMGCYAPGLTINNND